MSFNLLIIDQLNLIQWSPAPVPRVLAAAREQQRAMQELAVRGGGEEPREPRLRLPEGPGLQGRVGVRAAPEDRTTHPGARAMLGRFTGLQSVEGRYCVWFQLWSSSWLCFGWGASLESFG